MINTKFLYMPLLLLLLLSRFSRVRLCATPLDGSPPGSAVPGILQARRLEWVAISFSNAWAWKEKVKSLSRVRLFATPWTAAYQAPPSMGFFQARVLEWGAIAFSLNASMCMLNKVHITRDLSSFLMGQNQGNSWIQMLFSAWFKSFPRTTATFFEVLSIDNCLRQFSEADRCTITVFL